MQDAIGPPLSPLSEGFAQEPVDASHKSLEELIRTVDDPDRLSVVEVKALLQVLGIEAPADASKATLVGLLTGTAPAPAGDVEPGYMPLSDDELSHDDAPAYIPMELDDCGIDNDTELHENCGADNAADDVDYMSIMATENRAFATSASEDGEGVALEVETDADLYNTVDPVDEDAEALTAQDELQFLQEFRNATPNKPKGHDSSVDAKVEIETDADLYNEIGSAELATQQDELAFLHVAAPAKVMAKTASTPAPPDAATSEPTPTHTNTHYRAPTTPGSTHEPAASEPPMVQVTIPSTKQPATRKPVGASNPFGKSSKSLHSPPTTSNDSPSPLPTTGDTMHTTVATVPQPKAPAPATTPRKKQSMSTQAVTPNPLTARLGHISNASLSAAKTPVSREKELLGEALVEETKQRMEEVTFDFSFSGANSAANAGSLETTAKEEKSTLPTTAVTTSKKIADSPASKDATNHAKDMAFDFSFGGADTKTAAPGPEVKPRPVPTSEADELPELPATVTSAPEIAAESKSKVAPKVAPKKKETPPPVRPKANDLTTEDNELKDTLRSRREAKTKAKIDAKAKILELQERLRNKDVSCLKLACWWVYCVVLVCIAVLFPG